MGNAPTHPRTSSPTVLRRLADFGLPPAALALLGALLLVPVFVRDEFILRLLISALMFGGLAMAFDFTAGFINIVNFGYAAFWGVGAYVSALLVVRLGWSPWLAMPAGALAAGVLGFLLGLLTIRLGGIFASCMTWFVALALMTIAGNLVELTNGHAGLTAPLLLDTTRNWPYFYLILGEVVAIYVLLMAIIRSRVGLAFRAIGQDLEAAGSSGVDAVRYKVLNFTISCAIAGLIGGFYAHFIGVLVPQVLHTSHTVEILAIAYIGGRGTIWGALVAALIMVPLMEYLKDLMEFRMILYGLMMIVIMIYYPKGLSGIRDSLVERLRARREARNPPPAPAN
jgi:branched-chain amino acid transport system permease protein